MVTFEPSRDHRERQLDGCRAGCQDDRLRLENFGITIIRGELYFPACEQLAVTHQAFDLVGFEQAGDAACQLAHDSRPALLHCGDIETELAGLDTVLLEFVPGAVVELGRLQHGFRRYTTRIQAGTAERVLAVPVLPLIDTRDAHTVLRGPNRSDIAAGSRADNNDIKFSAHLRLVSLNL
jgi:hypothetical protein